jgi:thiol-disulfide isomerase/thioredoxin
MKYFNFVLTLLLLPAVVLYPACQGQNGYTIKGSIQNAANLQVGLDQAFFDRSSTAIGKVAADASGNFVINQEKPFEQGLYMLTIGAKRLYFLLDGKEKTVDIKGELSTLDKMEVEVTGSEAFSCYVKTIQELINNPIKDADGATAAVEKSCNPLMKSFMALQVYGNQPQSFIEPLKKTGAELNAYMPNSKYATDYNATLATLEQSMAQQNSGEKIQVGQPAPDISLPGPDGKVRSLSSLKGKVVLLDFWASWCGPCRRENPHVVEVYNKYKSKGFDIYSVSLDGADPRMKSTPEEMKQKKESGKQKWIAAIKQDGLVWDNHVSDLQYWGSTAAALYGVQAIPKTFLIDREGKIIAINPRQNLEQELMKVL